MSGDTSNAQAVERLILRKYEVLDDGTKRLFETVEVIANQAPIVTRHQEGE